MLWLMPLDFKNLYELFTTLVEDGDSEVAKDTEEEKYKKWVKGILAVTGIIISLYIIYIYIWGGGSSPAPNNIPEPVVNTTSDLCIDSMSSSDEDLIADFVEDWKLSEPEPYIPATDTVLQARTVTITEDFEAIITDTVLEPTITITNTVDPITVSIPEHHEDDFKSILKEEWIKFPTPTAGPIVSKHW